MRHLLPRRRRSSRPATSPLALALALQLTAVAALPSWGEEAGDRPDTPTGAPAGEEEASAPPAATSTFSERVTVTATATPRRLDDTPGSVTLIDGEELQRQLAAGVEDLVRYEPGVYTDGDPTRLGAGGFNVRGIGGNRVLTRVDGIPTAEEFAFGPLAVPRYALDVESLAGVEIVKSAGSSLYGSDGLGGVVTLITRDPADYLEGRGRHLGIRTGYLGRSGEWSAGASGALGGERWEVSLLLAGRDGREADNQGTVEARDATRTAPNPQGRESAELLAKAVWHQSAGSDWKLALEVFDARTLTEAFSLQGVNDLGPSFGPGVTYRIDTRDFDADDRQDRRRLSLDHSFQTSRRGLPFDRGDWRLYAQRSTTEQRTAEERATTVGGGPLGPIRTADARRFAGLDFEQDIGGAEVQLRKGLAPEHGEHLLTYGATLVENRFDMLRDRRDVDAASGAPLPATEALPTKYFPESWVREIGAYLQDEISLRDGRLLVVLGARFDDYRIDPDGEDPVYLSGNPGTPAPEELSESAVSPRAGVVARITGGLSLFVQYARGFRSPPYSAANNGFTNATFGYTTLPNPDLKPETSDNFELGLRGSHRRGSYGMVLFDSRYEDFIETVTVGLDPATGLIQFQPQNVSEARIRGIELTGSLRLRRGWSLRGALAVIEGEDVTADLPLGSVAPPQGVLGMRYAHPGGRWGAELVSTLAAAKDEDDVDRSTIDQFAPGSYQLIDLTTFIDVSPRIRLTVGVFNLLDETYWTWPSARGLEEGSPVLDRYTGPGRNAAVSVRFRL